MTVSAYVLIQTEVGKAVSVAEQARKITGVLSADDVTGPYDVIVKTEAPTLDELGRWSSRRSSRSRASRARSRARW